jgi:hypothetical protein
MKMTILIFLLVQFGYTSYAQVTRFGVLSGRKGINSSIRYAEFVMPLVKAVQELSSKVEEQQNTIDKLLRQLENTSGEKSDSGTILYQNSPNPFSTGTEIKMSLPEAAHSASVLIYTLDGKELTSIQVNGRGNTSVVIPANQLGAGMYIYSLLVDNQVIDTKRMILTE